MTNDWRLYVLLVNGAPLSVDPIGRFHRKQGHSIGTVVSPKDKRHVRRRYGEKRVCNELATAMGVAVGITTMPAMRSVCSAYGGNQLFDHTMANFTFSDVTHKTPVSEAVAGRDWPHVLILRRLDSSIWSVRLSRMGF